MAYEFRIETGDVTTVAPPPPSSDIPPEVAASLPGGISFVSPPETTTTATTIAAEETAEEPAARTAAAASAVGGRKRRRKKEVDEDFVPSEESGGEDSGSGSGSESADDSDFVSDNDSPASASDAAGDDDDEEDAAAGLRKPKTAFFLFCDGRRPLLRAEHPELKPAKLRSLLSQLWRDLPQQQREPFLEAQRVDRARYKQELRARKAARQAAAANRRRSAAATAQTTRLLADIAATRRVAGTVPPPPVNFSLMAGQPLGVVDPATLRAASLLIASQLKAGAAASASAAVPSAADAAVAAGLYVPPQQRMPFSALPLVSGMPPIAGQPIGATTTAAPATVALPQQPGAMQPPSLDMSQAAAAMAALGGSSGMLPPIAQQGGLAFDPLLLSQFDIELPPKRAKYIPELGPGGFPLKRGRGGRGRGSRGGRGGGGRGRGGRRKSELAEVEEPTDDSRVMISYTDTDGKTHVLPLVLCDALEQTLPEKIDWYCRVCRHWVEESQENISCCREGCGRCYHAFCVGIPPGEVANYQSTFVCPPSIGCKQGAATAAAAATAAKPKEEPSAEPAPAAEAEHAPAPTTAEPILSAAELHARRQQQAAALAERAKRTAPRYFAGRAPQWLADADTDEDDDEEETKPTKAPKAPAPAVGVPSVNAVAAEAADEEDDAAKRHRAARERAKKRAAAEEEEELQQQKLPPAPAQATKVKEEDGDEIARRHAAARERAQIAAAAAVPTAEEDDEEEDEEEEWPSRPVFQPSFVRADERATLLEAERRAKEEQAAAMEAERRRKGMRGEQARERLQQVLSEEAERMKSAAERHEEEALDKDVDEAEEFELWRQREAERVRLEQAEREEFESERSVLERNRQEAAAAPEPAEAQKHHEHRKWKFLQKYYHVGAFFRDGGEWDVAASGKWDFNQATGDDSMVTDRSALPKVMQVKNFGKAGRTKYTHLLDQDTTRRGADNPWGPRQVFESTARRMAGTKPLEDAPPPTKKPKKAPQ